MFKNGNRTQEHIESLNRNHTNVEEMGIEPEELFKWESNP